MTTLQHPTGEPELVALVREMNEDLQKSPDTEYNADLWSALVGTELNLVGLSQDAGGPGGTLPDLVATVFECARAAAAIPLVENYLGQWIRAHGNLGVTPKVAIHASVASAASKVVTPHDRGASEQLALSWATHADELVIVDRAGATAQVSARWIARPDDPELDLAGQPAGLVEVGPESLGESAVEVTLDEPRFRSMVDLLRAAQLSGGIRGCFELSRQYASEREQFGVRIDTFPAVQHHLIQLAQAAAITRVSVFRAAAAIEADVAGDETARSARLVCDRSAREAIRCAHQLHGAIGMTREYRLASLTRRLNWWRLIDLGQPRAGFDGSGFVDAVWRGGLVGRP